MRRQSIEARPATFRAAPLHDALGDVALLPIRPLDDHQPKVA
jgi:hypothetical protein